MDAATCLKQHDRCAEAVQHFREAYQMHLEDLNRPHLSFSALFPLFFASLREKEGHCGRGQLVVCEDHSSDALLDPPWSSCR